jgi:hypothetical protein
MTSTIGMALVLTVVAGWLVGCATAPASRADKETLLAEAASALQRMRADDASAVVLKTGVTTDVSFIDGVAVVVSPIGGVMLEAAIGGQQFTYQPK